MRIYSRLLRCLQRLIHSTIVLVTARFCWKIKFNIFVELFIYSYGGTFDTHKLCEAQWNLLSVNYCGNRTRAIVKRMRRCKWIVTPIFFAIFFLLILLRLLQSRIRFFFHPKTMMLVWNSCMSSLCNIYVSSLLWTNLHLIILIFDGKFFTATKILWFFTFHQNKIIRNLSIFFNLKFYIAQILLQILWYSSGKQNLMEYEKYLCHNGFTTSSLANKFQIINRSLCNNQS